MKELQVYKCLDKNLLLRTSFWLKFDYTRSISKTFTFFIKFTLYDDTSTSFYFENPSSLIMINIFTDYKHLIMTFNYVLKILLINLSIYH